MPTNNRRRTIACLLRHINMTHDPNWSSVISCLGVTSREKAVLALADLIEPQERTCRIYDTDHGFEDSIRCDACQMTFRRPWQPFKFCPNCGARVIQE